MRHHYSTITTSARGSVNRSCDEELKEGLPSALIRAPCVLKNTDVGWGGVSTSSRIVYENQKSLIWATGDTCTRAPNVLITQR